MLSFNGILLVGVCYIHKRGKDYLGLDGKDSSCLRSVQRLKNTRFSLHSIFETGAY